MVERAKRYLRPPAFQDERKMHAANLINTVIWISLAAAGMYPLIVLATGQSIDYPMNWIILGLILTLVALRILLHHGYIQLTSLLFSLVLWVSFSIPMFRFAGIHDTAVTGYFVVVILASLVSGKRIFLFVSLLCAVSVVGAFYAEQTGNLVVEFTGPSSAEDLILLLVLLSTSALLSRAVIGRVSSAYEHARHAARNMAEANRQLEANRATLQAHTSKLEASTHELDRSRAELEEANRRLEETLHTSQRRADMLQASIQVSHAIAQIHDQNILLSRVTHLISQHFGFYHTGIFLIDEPSSYAVLRAANSLGGQKMLARQHKLRVGSEGIVGYVTSTGQSRIALDVGIDTAHVKTPELPATRSEMAVPLRVGNEILGALDVQSTQETAFDEEDIAVLTGLADQIALAIQNTWLFQQAQAALSEVQESHRRYVRDEWDRFLTSHQVRPTSSRSRAAQADTAG